MTRPASGDGVERLFHAVVASVKDYAIFMLDRSGRVATWNAGAELIKGYRPEEVIGKEISIFYTPEDIAGGKPRALLAAALAHGRVEDEGWRVRKDGSRFWADVVITPVLDPAGQPQGYVKVTRDLTARKQAEDRLRRSEESLQATLYSIGDGVLATDEQARVTRVNPVAERLTGWPEAEAVGRPIGEIFRIINEETRAAATNPVARVLAEGVVVGLANHTALISRDGSERPIADSGAPIFDAQGKPVGAVLVFRNISEERQKEEALRESDEKLRLMIASVHDYALYMLDPDGLVVSWNPGAEKITGYRCRRNRGPAFFAVLRAEDREGGETGARARDRKGWALRRGIVAHTQGRGAVLGKRRHHARPRCVEPPRRVREDHARSDGQTESRRANECGWCRRGRRSGSGRIPFHRVARAEDAADRLAAPARNIRTETRATGRAGDRKIERAKRIGDRLARLIEALLDVSRIATGRCAQARTLRSGRGRREIVERLRDGATAGCVLTRRCARPVRKATGIGSGSSRC